MGKIPYGYMVGADGIHLEINTHEQEVLALMKDLKRYLSLRQIAEELNEHQIFKRNGKPWHYSCVRLVINNGIRDICLFSESSS